MGDDSQLDQSALTAQLREAYGRTAYSHKVHEKDADRYFHRGRVVRTWKIVLSAVTAGGAATTALGEGVLGAALAAITSTVLLILTTYMKEVDLGEIAQRHSETATRLWDVRETYLSLLADLRDGTIDLQSARKRRDEIQEEVRTVYQNAPRTSEKAYKKAQEALQLNEELTFTEGELDRLLPPALRDTSS